MLFRSEFSCRNQRYIFKRTVYECFLVFITTTNRSEKIKASLEYKLFKASYDNEVDHFQSSMNEIVEKNTPIDVDNMLSYSLNLIDQAKGSYGVMEMLQNMRQYDDLTFAHSLNVSMICNIFADWLKWSEEEKELLTVCGLLHDIGKLKIPEIGRAHV